MDDVLDGDFMERMEALGEDPESLDRELVTGLGRTVCSSFALVDDYNYIQTMLTDEGVAPALTTHIIDAATYAYCPEHAG